MNNNVNSDSAVDSDAVVDNVDDVAGSGGDEADPNGRAEANGVAVSASNHKRPPSPNNKNGDNNNNGLRGNKKRKGQHSNGDSDLDHQGNNLCETTTIEDLSTIDASTYLAWVNQQAKQLPSVHIAPKSSAPNDECKGDGGTAEKKQQSALHNSHDDEPIDGSAATLQVLLSKQMHIFPAPTSRHLPPLDDTNDNNQNENHAEPASLTTMTTTNVETKNPSFESKNCSHWISNTISNFSKLRSYLEQEDAQQQQIRNRKIVVPRMKDRAAWHVFCLGKEESRGNVGGYYEDFDESDADDNDICAQEGGGIEGDSHEKCNNNDPKFYDSNNNELKDNFQNSNGETNQLSAYNPTLVPSTGYPPTTSLMLQLDQVLTRTLFHHHVHYLCEWKFPLTKQRSAWIYALLARMEKPWHREECCAVRSVLRECCLRRWELELPTTTGTTTTTTTTTTTNLASVGDDNAIWEQLALLNTLIAICGIYYEQGAYAGGDGIQSLFTVHEKEE